MSRHQGGSQTVQPELLLKPGLWSPDARHKRSISSPWDEFNTQFLHNENLAGFSSSIVGNPIVTGLIAKIMRLVWTTSRWEEVSKEDTAVDAWRTIGEQLWCSRIYVWYRNGQLFTMENLPGETPGVDSCLGERQSTLTYEK